MRWSTGDTLLTEICAPHAFLPALPEGSGEMREISDMKHDPIVLDEHRGMAAQKDTEIRRRVAEVEADQAALRESRTELEKFLLAVPASTWPEAADKARYLIGLFAGTSLGRDPRRQKLIAGVLDDFARLADEPAAGRSKRE